jgi:hypothetical protein
MRRTIIAALSLGVLVCTSAAASAQVCIVGIFAAAFYANAHDHRELTPKEAWTCGIAYGTDAPAAKPEKRKKIARRVKRE